MFHLPCTCSKDAPGPGLVPVIGIIGGLKCQKKTLPLKFSSEATENAEICLISKGSLAAGPTYLRGFLKEYIGITIQTFLSDSQ